MLLFNKSSSHGFVIYASLCCFIKQILPFHLLTFFCINQFQFSSTCICSTTFLSLMVVWLNESVGYAYFSAHRVRPRLSQLVACDTPIELTFTTSSLLPHYTFISLVSHSKNQLMALKWRIYSVIHACLAYCECDLPLVISSVSPYIFSFTNSD